MGGFSGLLAGRLLQLAGGFAVSVVLVSRYGMAAAGTYALAALGTQVACLLTAAGLANSLPRQDLGDGERAGIALAATLALLVPLAAAAALYGWCLGHDRAEAIAVAAFAFSGAALGQVNVLNCLYVLQRRSWAGPLSPALHLAAVALAGLAPDVTAFALTLAAGRALGSLAGFLPLRFGRFSPRDLRRAISESSRFVPLDIMALLSEQLPILAISPYLGRAELGLIGLARQFVTLADTPGWSYVQSEYPRLVRGLKDSAAAIARRNGQLAWVSCGLTAATATGMALGVYRSPTLVPVLAAMLLPLPARYLNHFCDQALRAGGRIGDSGTLAAAKTLLALPLTLAAVWAFGFWGAVAASAVVAALAGLAYRWRVTVLFPGILPPLRPWSPA